MSRSIQHYFFLSIGLVLIAHLSNAQNSWEPVKMDVAGHNIVNNVEASFQKTTCNNEEVIFVKFTNRNNYPVVIKWYDAILTQSGSWVKKDDSTAKKVLEIGAGREVKGVCSPDGESLCAIKLSDYLSKLPEYKLYAIYRFEVAEKK
ncbi:MAG: hypothetical protein WAQ28_00975 [Bacteroidia bacterium]